jgi:hypothetical protein
VPWAIKTDGSALPHSGLIVVVRGDADALRLPCRTLFGIGCGEQRWRSAWSLEHSSGRLQRRAIRRPSCWKIQQCGRVPLAAAQGGLGEVGRRQTTLAQTSVSAGFVARTRRTFRSPNPDSRRRAYISGPFSLPDITSGLEPRAAGYSRRTGIAERPPGAGLHGERQPGDGRYGVQGLSALSCLGWAVRPGLSGLARTTLLAR